MQDGLTERRREARLATSSTDKENMKCQSRSSQQTREFSDGQQLQLNQNTEKSSQVTLKRDNLKVIKISRIGNLLMLWETAEHWSIRVFSALVHDIVTELALYLFSSTPC